LFGTFEMPIVTLGVLYPKKNTQKYCYEGIIIILKDCASMLSLHAESSHCDYNYVTSYFTLCIWN